jgi:predicted CXXCH cytochrome family protein
MRHAGFPRVESRGAFPFVRGIGFLALLVAACAADPVFAADRTILLFPPDLTLSTDAKINVFVFQGGKGAGIRLFVNGTPGAPLEGTAFLKGEALLRPGMNLVKAGPKGVRVYHLAEPGRETFSVKGKKGKTPLVFRSYRMHPALEDGCEGCHVLNDGKLQAKDQKEACYACHGDFEKTPEGERRFLHEPVASGECTSCHDPHYSALPKLRKNAEGCIGCHDPFPAQGSVHRPVRSRQCTACHDPHAGAAPKQLVRKGNGLCTGCHQGFHFHHRGEAVSGAMTVLPPDMPRDGRSLSCLACHAAHQSPREQLLLDSREALCRRCHPR